MLIGSASFWHAPPSKFAEPRLKNCKRMDLLIIEPLEAEVMQWLEARYAVRYAPELANDPRAFRQALYNVRAMIVPPPVTLDAQALHYAPVLRAVGRVSAGAEN